MTTLDHFEIQDLLDNLVERSMVICDPVTGRYQMSESMRVYASDQLPNEQPEMDKAHFEYFLGYAEKMFAHNRRLDDAKALALFIPEVDNIRHAYDWSIDNDPKRCLHLICCVGPSWFRFSRPEGMPLAFRALDALPDTADADHISIRAQLARSKMRQGLFDEARVLLDRAIRQMNETEVDSVLQVFVTGSIGVLASYMGNRQLARERTMETLELARKYGLVAFEAASNINLGEIFREAGDLSVATQYYEEALRLSSGDPFSDSLTFFNLGCTALEQNDIEKAESCFRRGLAADALVDIAGANANLGGLGYICILKGHYREAGLLMGYPEVRRERQKGRMDPMDERMFERFRKLGSELGGEEYEKAFAEGGLLNREQLTHVVEQSRTESKSNTRAKPPAKSSKPKKQSRN